MSLLMEALKKAERAKQGQTPAPEGQPDLEREIPTLLASDYELEPHAAPQGAAPTRSETTQPQTKVRERSYATQGDSNSLRSEARERSYARSVFTAKQPVGNRKRQIVGITLAIATGIAGAVTLYWPTISALIPGHTPHAVSPPPRVAAPTIPPAPVAAAIPAATPAPVPSPSDENKNTPIAIAPDTEKNDTPDALPTPRRKSTHPLRRSARATSAAPAPTGDELEPVEANNSRRTSARNGSKPAGENPAIQFQENTAATQVNPALSGAYQFFISGNLEMAQQQYQKFLRQEPNNRDALLGLATIAAKRKQLGQATAYYNKLLELDPADPDAMAGLLGAEGQADPTQSESRLKRMLAQNPQAGALYFTLGNLYSQQSRWADAQQAYFRAYSCTPGNADYAFNLAISLEHLNQNKPALDYYQRALALSQSGPANFDKASVQNRIKELQQAIPRVPQPAMEQSPSGQSTDK